MARTSWVIVIFGDVVDWVTRRPQRAALGLGPSLRLTLTDGGEFQLQLFEGRLIRRARDG
jgi:hypothetical protein